jgi:hypothetical protein
VKAAIITASVTALVAIIGIVASQVAQRETERRQARLERVNAQLRELYGPLFALSEVNEAIWRRSREVWLPSTEVRRSGSELSPGHRDEWNDWFRNVFMPTNRAMRDLIVAHAELLIETEMPGPLMDLCAHVAAYEIVLLETSPDLKREPLFRHPGAPFVDYTRSSFAALKAQQRALLRQSAPRVSRKGAAADPPDTLPSADAPSADALPGPGA